MAINKGYLTAKTDKASDEVYTPDYAVKPILKFLKPGDIIAFYHGNKILVKRVIAGAGSWVNITIDGDVYVNGELLEENYIQEKMLGETNITYPYQVPDGSWFVLGDHREVSIDSRNSEIGCIKQEDIVGKIIFRVWPLKRIGKIN